MTRRLHWRSLTFRILTSVIDKLCLIHNKKTGCYKQSLHGARPRQPSRERPAVIEDRPPLEATGGVDGRKPDQAPLLSPAGTADLDGRGSDNTTERVSSNCRKSGLTTEGGRPAPDPRGSPRGVRAVPKIFMEGRSRDSGLDRQKDIEGHWITS